MKCQNCSHEQNDGLFCSKCGEKYQSQNGENVPREKRHVKEEKVEKAVQQSNRKKMNVSIHKESIKVAAYLSIPTLLIISIFAWVFTLLLKSTVLIKDYTYLLFANVLGISDNVLVELVTQLKVTLWDVLVVTHVGSYEGFITGENIEAIQFRSHLPVIIAPILLICLLIFINRFIKSKFNFSFGQWVQGLLFSSIIYALMVTIVVKVLEPTYQTSVVTYALSTPLSSLFFKALILFLISGVIGLKLWQPNQTKRTTLSRLLVALRPFFVTLMSALLIIGVIVVGMWALLHPSAIFTKPSTTPASLWTIYNRDLMFYLLVPTFLFGELLYAIGSSLSISSSQIADLLQLPNALKMNALTGVTVIGEQAYDLNLLKTIEKSTRFIWYAFVFLLIYLFSLNQLKAVNIKDRLIQIGVIALFFSFIATVISFSFTNGQEGVTGSIGFSAITTGLMIIVISTIFFVIKHVLKGKAITTKVGDQTE